MKNSYLIIIATVMAAMLFLPLAATAVTVADAPTVSTLAPVLDSSVKVKMTESGEIISLETEDYVLGVVAAEVPSTYNEEALKAQAVAARTFLYYEKGKASHSDYDITDDFTLHQAFITKETLKEKWGEKFDENYAKIKAAVDGTKGEILTHDGKPIFAAYHAISSGKTENAENLWEKSYPYLLSVDSIGDLLCPDYLSTVSVSVEDFKKAFEKKAELPEDKKSWVSNCQNTDSGTVIKIKVGDKEFKGSEIRELFSLRSSSFDLTFDGTDFVFTVRGYGHGVGMSQNGANYMAQQGSDYKEILNWYYRDCKIEKALE